MNEGKGNNVLLVIIAIATLLVAVIGATFAYFTAILEDEETGETIRINSGTIGTTFVGGSAISALAAYPRDDDWGKKVFTLTGTTKTDAIINYGLSLVVSKNSFTPDALKYTLLHDESSTSDIAYGLMAPEVSDPTSIPGSGVEDLGDGHFQGPSPEEGPIIHTYILTVYFPETGSDQSEDLEAELNAHIEIDAPDLTTSSYLTTSS